MCRGEVLAGLAINRATPHTFAIGAAGEICKYVYDRSDRDNKKGIFLIANL